MLLDFCPFETKAACGLPDTAKTPRIRRTPGERLLQSVMDLAGPRAELCSHGEVPWASVTFSGSRHTIVLQFHGWEACDDAENLIAELPEHEFRIAGVLVADATVARTDQQLLPEPRMEVELELLLLDDK